MLLKSKTGAFVMGCIYVLAAFISLTLLRLLSAPEEDLLDPIFKLDMSELPPGMRLLGWLSLAGSILLAGWILSWAIHGGSEMHFGRSGAARWAVGGFLYGMWANSVAYPLLQSTAVGTDLLADVMLILGMPMSYGIVFLLPQGGGPDPDSGEKAA
jgi:hypothetical protein